GSRASSGSTRPRTPWAGRRRAAPPDGRGTKGALARTDRGAGRRGSRDPAPGLLGPGVGAPGIRRRGLRVLASGPPGGLRVLASGPPGGLRVLAPGPGGGPRLTRGRTPALRLPSPGAPAPRPHATRRGSMDLADEYRAQAAWRRWGRAYEA